MDKRIRDRKIDEILTTFDFIKVQRAANKPIHRLVLDAHNSLENVYDFCLNEKNEHIARYVMGDYHISYKYNKGDVWMELEYILSIGYMNYTEQ